MTTLYSKLAAFVIALSINTLMLGAVGYLFEIQSQPHLSVMSFAHRLATHPWLI